MKLYIKPNQMRMNWPQLFRLFIREVLLDQKLHATQKVLYQENQGGLYAGGDQKANTPS